MIHISEGISGNTDQTNPAHKEPHHPATSADSQAKESHENTKTKSPSIAAKGPRADNQAKESHKNIQAKSPTIAETDPRAETQAKESFRHFKTESTNASLKNVKMDKQRGEYVKHLASSIRASPSDLLGDLVLHIISTFNSSLPELGEYHNECNYSNGSPLHGHKGNPQPTL